MRISLFLLAHPNGPKTHFKGTLESASSTLFIMPILQQIADWLETHWVTPAYSGWLLGGLALFLFGAATNTMAGWLYVMSGVLLALLAISVMLPGRMLQDMQIQRLPIQPMSAGDMIAVEIVLHNPTAVPKSLIQVIDEVPSRFGVTLHQAIEQIPAHTTYRWVYHQLIQQRGIYRWQFVALRTAAPLGLFWCRRRQALPAEAVVYPSIVSLACCPLIDQLGYNDRHHLSANRPVYGATEGLTRALRPYRWGDPIRLVHWRTSARYGELRVRELESYQGEQTVAIVLDSAFAWEFQAFEQAVIAAASLYFYALQQGRGATLWTAATGQLYDNRRILKALAATQPGELQTGDRPGGAILWLSQNPDSLVSLSINDRWLLWMPSDTHTSLPPTLSSATPPSKAVPAKQQLQATGRVIHGSEPLETQLQAPS